MSIDPRQVAQVGWELIAVLPLLLLIKVAIVAMLARLFGMALPKALLAGLVLAPFDEIGFVIFASAHDSGLLDADAYALGLTLISFSFITSSLLINFGYRFVQHVFGNAAPPSVEPMGEMLEEHVLIVGYSYAGRVICSMLERVGIRYVAFDLDLDRVAEGRALGHDVHYGDVTDPNMLGAAAIAKARAAVVTTHEYEHTKRVTGNLRHFYPQVPVLTAVPYLFQRDELRRLGASQTVALMPEGMLDFGALVLGRLQVESTEIERLTEELRADDYALLRGVGGLSTAESSQPQAT